MRKYIVIEWTLVEEKNKDEWSDYDIEVWCQEVKHDDDIQKMLLRDMKLKDILK